MPAFRLGLQLPTRLGLRGWHHSSHRPASRCRIHPSYDSLTTTSPTVRDLTDGHGMASVYDGLARPPSRAAWRRFAPGGTLPVHGTASDLTTASPASGNQPFGTVPWRSSRPAVLTGTGGLDEDLEGCR